MQYVIDQLWEQARALLAATGLVAGTDILLTDPKPNIQADIAFATFQAARSTGENPAALASKLAAGVSPLITEDSLVGKVEATGPFVNISINPANFTRAVLAEVIERGPDFGHDDLGKGESIIVEFSSPNIARKMHVGHLRSTVIGNAIRNIFVALGYSVLADNHLGDWGTQFGMLLAAYTTWGLPSELADQPIEALVRLYSRFNDAAKEDPALRDQARDWFRRLEAGDEQARKIWEWMIEITLQEFARTYERLGVTFDTQHGESFYEPMLDGVIQEALTKKVAKIEADGAVSVSFDEKMPSFLLRKSDGATLYQTRDVATCFYRAREYHPQRVIYVVGQEQKLHFRQVFETVRLMGYPEITEKLVHISFGPVTDATGQRFSMRKGNSIFLDEVLDEAIVRARAVIAEKMAEGKTELTPDEQENVSQTIGTGAVIYNDLYQGPDRGIQFDWDKMLAFDGNSAPYIQYTYARCRSILRKVPPAVAPLPLAITATALSATLHHVKTSTPAQANPENFKLLVNAEELAVIRQLARLPVAVRRAGSEFLPALVAEVTYGIARDFARFYHEHSVLEAETPELRDARIGLVSAVAIGLRNGLALLGIKAPERM